MNYPDEWAEVIYIAKQNEPEIGKMLEILFWKEINAGEHGISYGETIRGFYRRILDGELAKNERSGNE